MRYLFSIADRGHNGFLSKEDLLDLLHTLMGTTLRFGQVPQGCLVDQLITRTSYSDVS